MGTFFNKFIAHNEETMNHRTTIAKYILTATLLLGDSLRAACDELVPPGSAVANFHNTAPWMKMRIPEG